MTGSIRSHLDKNERNAAYARRAEWKYPEGIKVLGEWWRASAPQICVVFEAQQYDPILALTSEWSDFMEMDISPCTTPDAGLAAARKFLGK
jgi:hypothetical protein